jgi:Ca-activated chloride channel family protein
MQKIILIFTLAVVALLSFTTLDKHVITGRVTDKDGNPIPFATVNIAGSRAGISADANGVFSIRVEDNDIIEVVGAGYKQVQVNVGTLKTITVVLEKTDYTLKEVVVTSAYSTKRTARNVSSSVQKVSAQQLNTVRQANVNSALAGKVAGVQVRTATSSVTSPAKDGVVRLRGENGLGNFTKTQDLDREGYDYITENAFQKVNDNPLSTFSIDVDAASYSNMRRFLNEGQLPPAGAIRIEEMVNYFKYEYPQPKAGDPFSVNTEISACPWNPNHRLALIGLQGKLIPVQSLPSANIVFLIDVSGSMYSEEKLPLLKQSLKLLVDQLRENDKVSLCVYAGNAGLVLLPTNGMQKQKIKDAIDALEAGGSTAGGEGIQLAYKTAKENFIKNGNNRVILCTDGDFNVGMSSDDELERMIEKERESGVFLTVLGFGMGNYQDAKMQKLADKGNGNNAYIDQLSEAKKVLVNEFGGTLFTIAKDVKLQIEFNPVLVQGYRLVGYENRMLNKEDFNDDKKDAGEMGSGHTVTALYEIIPVGENSDFLKRVDTLKYQQEEKFSPSVFSKELMTIKLRYKQPDGAVSKLMEVPVTDTKMDLQNTSANYRFASSVAEFGMLLRSSSFKQQATYKNVINLAQNAIGTDSEGYRKEFLQLVQKATTLAKKADRIKRNTIEEKEEEDVLSATN